MSAGPRRPSRSDREFESRVLERTAFRPPDRRVSAVPWARRRCGRVPETSCRSARLPRLSRILERSTSTPSTAATNPRWPPLRSLSTALKYRFRISGEVCRFGGLPYRMVAAQRTLAHQAHTCPDLAKGSRRKYRVGIDRGPLTDAQVVVSGAPMYPKCIHPGRAEGSHGVRAVRLVQTTALLSGTVRTPHDRPDEPHSDLGAGGRGFECRLPDHEISEVRLAGVCRRSSRSRVELRWSTAVEGQLRAVSGDEAADRAGPGVGRVQRDGAANKPEPLVGVTVFA
jgi:hypothetical protein